MAEIVVGIDGSAGSHQALRWALTQARCYDAEVVAVHLYSYTLPDVPDSAVGEPEIIEEVVATAERRARGVVDKAIAAAGHLAEGVKITPSIIRSREPAEQLLRAAEGADLLVVGSRGLGGFAKLVLGSVSRKCLDHASGTVLVARGEPPGSRHG